MSYYNKKWRFNPLCVNLSNNSNQWLYNHEPYDLKNVNHSVQSITEFLNENRYIGYVNDGKY